MSSISGIANDLDCFFKKYLPASIKTFLGIKPISSEPVTLKPLALALSQVFSNTSCKLVTLILVKL